MNRAYPRLTGLVLAGCVTGLASPIASRAQQPINSILQSPSQASGAQPTSAQTPRAISTPTIISADVEDVNLHQAMYSVRGNLRELLVAEEAFWRSRHTYAPDVSFLPMFHPTPGVAVQIVQARADGWSARAAFSDGLGLPHSCAIWVGEIAPSERPATDVEHKVYPEAEVSCDGDGYTTKGEWTAAGRAYMTYALDRLVQSESRFFAFHRRFTTDTTTLEPFIWDRDVTVAISAATANGWAARASFGPSPGRSCVIWHGVLPDTAIPTTSPARRAPPQDQVVCD
jgi:hypothetical protein